MTSGNRIILTFCMMLTLILISCNEKDDNTLRVGVITGPMQQVAEVAKKVAKDKYGLNVEVIGFNDYVMPNEALLNGDIDLNAYQHEPYLKQQEKERGYRFSIVGKTFIYPIAGYSEKINSISELHERDEIAIPNDPTNLSRSLLLLQSIGLLTLKENDTPPTTLDVISNPKKLKIIELEAPQLTRVLSDPKIVIAIINTSYASQIGLNPEKDGLFVEGKDSQYVNVIVSREKDKNSEKIREFVLSYQTQEVSDAARKIFGDSVIKGW